MAIEEREYLCSVNVLNEPTEVTGAQSIALRVTQLLLLNPGSDPLHPDMGVGLKNYRYCFDMSELATRIEEQIETYLPYPNAQVNLIRTPTKLLNIEIVIGQTKFIYDSEQAAIPIELVGLQD